MHTRRLAPAAAWRQERSAVRKTLLWLCVLTLLGLLALVATSQEPGGGDTAVPVIVDNPESAVPVTVDGASGPGEYDGANALSYESGSLYRAAPQFGRNRFIAVASPVAHAKGLYMVFNIASTRVAPGTYAAGQKVANITFQAALGGPPVSVTLQVRGAKSAKFGPFDYLLDTDGDGKANGTASKYGVLAAAAFSPSPLSPEPHLVAEVAVPLNGQTGPNAFYQNGRVQAEFFTADGTEYHISDSYVTVSPELLTRSDAQYVPVRVQVQVGNIDKEGQVPVTILSTTGFDATTVDPATVVLRDVRIEADFPSDFYTVGARPVKANHASSAKEFADLVLWFHAQDMRSAGGFDKTSTEAILVGVSSTAGNISDKAPVRTSP